jgi:transcription elongation factor GreA
MEELELESSAPILLTPEGMARLKEELTRLTVNKRAEIAERIRESKDHGEYAEDNNELDEVKQEQAIVENRIAELKVTLSNAETLDLKQVPTKEVGLGSFVTLKDDRGSFEVRIVASVEANPDEDTVSEESPLGQAIYGRPLGDTVEFIAPGGKMKYNIAKIRA